MMNSRQVMFMTFVDFEVDRNYPLFGIPSLRF
jgi:hypothetical protein